MNILKVTRYQLSEYIKPIVIFFSILFLVTLSIMISISSGDQGQSNGLDFAILIFLFVLGLNSFKTSFKFMQSMNVSRIHFFVGNIISFIIIAVLMSIIGSILNTILSEFFNYRGMYLAVYQDHYILKEILWLTTLFFLIINVGFFITMLYYKCNTMMKVIISLTPVWLPLILDTIISVSSQSFNVYVFVKPLEFLYNQLINAYLASLWFIIGFIIITGFNYLFIRRMTIKQ